MQTNNSKPCVATEREWLAVRADYQDWHQFFSLINRQVNTIGHLATGMNSLTDSPEVRQSTRPWQASLTRYRAHLTATVDVLQQALNELEADAPTERVNWLVYIHPVVTSHMRCFAHGIDALLTELENHE